MCTLRIFERLLYLCDFVVGVLVRNDIIGNYSEHLNETAACCEMSALVDYALRIYNTNDFRSKMKRTSIR